MSQNVKQMRDALVAIRSYLDLKAEQYAMDYPENHAIRLTCDRMRDLASDVLTGCNPRNPVKLEDFIEQ